MLFNDWIQIIIFVASLIILTPLLGGFMARVFQGEKHFLQPVFSGLEKGIYRIARIDPKDEMTWQVYAKALIIFNLLGFAAVFILQIFQGSLPLNPQQLSSISWDSAFNTAVSFMTNTNWQAYAGETSMSYFTQMMGLGVQNFLSAATGIAVMLALVRGITRRASKTLGNFWTDVTRSILYILLPLSLLLAVFLLSQGVVQSFHAYVTAHTLEGVDQVIPLGPAASQIAIKQLGTNGGGFFNANSAHPFENPTPLSNFIQMLAILLIPAALIYSYGIMIRSKRQAWILYSAMMLLFLAALAASLYGEFSTNPIFHDAGFWEGKETRFGIVNSVIWSTATTAASNGSVNAMHSSLSPIAGGVALFNMMLGEIVFGGVGAGFYGMIVFVILTVFIAGLMVGRTPEYLGKKIQTREVALLIITILLPSGVILIGSSLALVLPAGLSSMLSKGPHGLSEILYAFTSASQNNGSAFAGLNANTPFYNWILGFCMIVGRFAVILPILAVAGSLVQKNISPPSSGSFKTDNFLFLALLLGVILVIGALTHLPSLALGPVAEHLLMLKQATF